MTPSRILYIGAVRVPREDRLLEGGDLLNSLLQLAAACPLRAGDGLRAEFPNKSPC